MNVKAVHIFLSRLTHESRLEKICRTTLKLKLVDSVEVIGLWENGLNRTEELGDIHFTRIATLSKTHPLNYVWLKMLLAIFSFVQFQTLVAFRIWKSKPSYIVIHNAALLPVGTLAAKLVMAKLIYEPHELESEQPGMNRIVSSLIRNIEKLFIKGCHSVVCVSIPIAEFYSRTFRITDERLFVVTNQPENPYFGQDYPRTDTFRKLFDIPERAIIYLYQGGLDESRGIQNYLDTFRLLGPEHHIVFMGYGEMEEHVYRYATECSNIHLKAAVPVNEILNYTSSADVGFIVIPDPDISSSYRMSLSNKFYEYAICGLHICLTDNLELMCRMVLEAELGSVIGSNRSDLKEWIMSTNQENLRKQSLKSKIFRRNTGWENEEKKYIDIYM